MNCADRIGRGTVGGTRRGFAAIYTVILLIALCALVSLGVDMGRVHVARSELQTAADAAVRAAAAGFADSAAQARSDAVTVARKNTCDGSSVVLDPNADIEFGTWDANDRVFTPLRGGMEGSADAIRVIARRTAARNAAIPLVFASVVGQSTFDIQAEAIATIRRGSAGGFAGLSGISVKNGAFIASYNSTWKQVPTQLGAFSNVVLASNGAIEAKNGGILLGDLQLGPSGSCSAGLLVGGDRTRLPAAVEAPPMPAWAPSTNPDNIKRDYTVNGNKTLRGGTYWFNSLDVDGTLTFEGPATLYVNGDIDLDGAIIASGRRPANLTIYQLGSSRTFGDKKSNGILVVAQVIAPGADFVAKNAATFCGSAIFDSMEAKNSLTLFYDEAIGGSGGGGRYSFSLAQ